MTTCELLLPTDCETTGLPLMSFAAAFPAKTFPLPERAQDSTANDPAYGQRLPVWFASFDPVSSLWRTCQCSLIEGLDEFSATWPRAGMTRNGKSLELTQLAGASTESEFGYWHTPTTRDAKGQSGLGNRIRRGKNGRLHVANLCDQLVDIGRPDLVRSITFREWLMGLPIGYTDCVPPETRSSRKSRS